MNDRPASLPRAWPPGVWSVPAEPSRKVSVAPRVPGRRVLLAALAPLTIGLAALAPASVAGQARPPEALTVFAAASLQAAMEDLGRLHVAQGAAPVRFAFGSSGALARQIDQGAPAGVYASADEAWMDWLEQRGRLASGTRRSLLGNRLVLVVPQGSAPARVDLVPGFDFAALLGARGRWVTGDPASVPVGRYAQAALERLGAWPSAAPRLVRAENVRVALAFVERGEVAAGVVYATDAAGSRRVQVAGTFPADSHPPIRYPVAALAAHDTAAARAFLRVLAAPAARAVWIRHGFTVLQ